VAGAGGKGDKLSVEAIILLGKVDGRGKVLRHVADFERGGHGVDNVGFVEIANRRKHEVRIEVWRQELNL
jgi:hypothetical protein